MRTLEAPDLQTAESDSDIIARQQAEIDRLQKVNNVLMDASERAVSVQGSDYGLFSTTVLLEERVHERTAALEKALEDLRQSNREREQVKEQVKHADHLLSMAISSISEGFVLFDENDQLLMWNQPYQELWSAGLRGLTLKQGMPYGSLLRSFCDHGLIHGNCGQWVEERIAQHASGYDSVEFELADGRWIKASEQRLENGGTVGIYTNLTEIRNREESIHQAELASKSTILQASLDSIPQGISVFNDHNKLVAWNDRFKSLLTIPDDALDVGTPYENLLRYDWGAEDRHAESAGGRLRPHVPCFYEREISHGLHIEVVRHPMPDGGFVSTYTDISSKKEAADHMQFLATHDGLTGIANRTLLMQSVSTELAHCRRHQTMCAILFMDLNKFKPVNDTYGHHIGDELLRLFTSRLSDLIREEDVLARLGGDEFAILMSDLSNLEDVPRLIRRIQRSAAEPFNIGDLNLEIGTSIGIATFPEDGQTGDVLMRNADMAMYHAKKNQTGHQFYNSELLES